MKVELKVVKGASKGKAFTFVDHDTFLFGRSPEARCCIEGDNLVSRNHFLIEINPPDCRLRDLGSKNGTYVNGHKHGGRPADADVDYSGPLPDPEVELSDKDIVKVGETELGVLIELDAVQKREIKCAQCGRKLPDEEAAKEKRSGDVICSACRAKAKSDPEEMARKLIQKVVPAKDNEAVPQLSDYEIIKKLGEGGMGAVFLARHKTTGHQAALKIILPKVAASEIAIKHFQREARTTAELKHRNIVEFYEQGYANGVFYIAMEFLDGGDLGKLIMITYNGRIPVSKAAPLMLQCLEGLAYAHAQGFVHRDLKPNNVLLGGSPQNPIAKISDFGLAKNFQEAGLSGYTATGAFTGTFVYMSPDQITNYKYSHPPVDVYSIGVTFYQMLTGEFPLDFHKHRDPLIVILQDPIIPIRQRNPHLPPPLAEVIDKAVNKDPGQRYKDAGEMLKALKKVL
jgi:eukaryotic-like serine/threonine-protein kinase